MIVAFWDPQTSRLCKFLYSFNIAPTNIFPYVLIPPPPYGWSKCRLFPCSTRQSIYLLWVIWFGKTACKSWSHAIYPLKLARGDQYPHLILLSLVYLLMSPQMIDIFPLGLPATVSPLPPHPILLHHHNNQTLLLPHSLRLFFFLALIPTIFMVTYIPPSEISSYVTITLSSFSMETYSASHDPSLSSSAS